MLILSLTTQGEEGERERKRERETEGDGLGGLVKFSVDPLQRLNHAYKHTHTRSPMQLGTRPIPARSPAEREGRTEREGMEK